MRLCVALALVSTLVSTTVLAAPKDKKKDDAGDEKKAGTSMDTGGDPAYSETSDVGPYAPKAAETKKAGAASGASVSRKAVFEVPPRDGFVVFGDVLYGFGRAPVPGPASDGETPDAKVLSLIVGAAYDFSPKFTLGLRVPWSTASVELPSRVSSQSSMAFGSPELFAEYRLRLGRPTELPLLFGAGAPVAQGDPDPGSLDDNARRQAVVNLLADAAHGWREGELYAPKRVPVILGAGIRHHRDALELHASTKVVLGINTGGDLVPRDFQGGGRLVVNSLSLRDVTVAGASYRILEGIGLWAGLDTWLVYEPIEPIEYESRATDPSPLQFVVEPRLGARFGKLRPHLGMVLPIGGRLADSGMTAFRLHVDYAL